MSRRQTSRKQIPTYHCNGCGHLLKEVRRMVTEGEYRREDWLLVHADEAEGATCEHKDGTCEPLSIDHNPHICLACSQKILRSEPEILVRNTRGRLRGQKRYRHANDEWCRAAMVHDRGSRQVSGGLVRGKK